MQIIDIYKFKTSYYHYKKLKRIEQGKLVYGGTWFEDDLQIYENHMSIIAIVLF